MTELHPSVYDIAPSVAQTIHNRYKAFVDLDDVKQECIKWALSRAEYLNEQLSEPEIKQRQHNEQRVGWQMFRAAERYARKEKSIRSGYHISDESYYETANLAQLLPYVIASVIDGTVLEQAQEMIRDGRPKGSSSPAEGGNLLAILIDIKKAYLGLDTEHQTTLVWRYHQSMTLAQIAQLLECAVSTADRRITFALRSLQDKLGGQSPWR